MKNFFTLLFVSLFTVLAASAEDTYVVAGVEVMMGSNWKGADADNQMTSSDGGETYTLVKEGVKLEAGIAYEYKIVKNGNPSPRPIFPGIWRINSTSPWSRAGSGRISAVREPWTQRCGAA